MSLNENEWPAEVVPYLSPLTITTAQTVREVSGVPLVPSPDPAAHVRDEQGAGRHCLVGLDGKARLSDATDLFVVHNRDTGQLWQAAQSVATVGGFGIYFDTQLNGERRVLIHVDNRPGRLMWVCPNRNRATESRTYVYFRADNPGPYLDILAQELARL